MIVCSVTTWRDAGDLHGSVEAADGRVNESSHHGVEDEGHDLRRDQNQSGLDESVR